MCILDGVELSELVELVAENPDAIEPFLVYADDLQEKGDPRGELINLELMRLEDPHDGERVRAVARHLDRHRHELLGPLVDLSACLTDAKWKLGFLKKITLLHPNGATPYEVARWVEVLLEAPSSAFLRELTLTPLFRGEYTPVLQTIAKLGAALRSLRIGPGHAHATRMDPTPISKVLTKLESLALAATRIAPAPLCLPALTELDLWIGELTPMHLQALANSELPSLLGLSIAFNHGRISDLPRYVFPAMPRLERLRVDTREPSELAGFVAELARSALARQLVALTIDGGGLEDIERLVDSAGAFTSLRRLSITSRADVDDLLDRLRTQGVEVSYRRTLNRYFDPWEEQTDVQLDPNDTHPLHLYRELIDESFGRDEDDDWPNY